QAGQVLPLEHIAIGGRKMVERGVYGVRQFAAVECLVGTAWLEGRRGGAGGVAVLVGIVWLEDRHEVERGAHLQVVGRQRYLAGLPVAFPPAPDFPPAQRAEPGGERGLPSR